jgi:hypothetical protein
MQIRLFKKLMNKLISLKIAMYNKFSQPNENPILIFGFPKSGTSVITGLLSQRTGIDATIDTKYLWEPYVSHILNGDLNFRTHVEKYSYPFAKGIIKEPNLVFIVEQVLEYYENPKVVVITRDKSKTIKSILDRLKLDGDLSSNPPENEIDKNWRVLLLSENRHYVQNISKKYDLAQRNLKKLEQYNPVYVKYEDFLQDKIKTIDFIAERLRLPIKNNIADIIDVPFQPKSRNKKSVKEFFGENIKYL